ncbi:hypothetical protein ACJMK2_029089 [Sinanodonta woodiana]|uniref:ARID domain-containing protein n=1 Tax=Sinanodonta woodiana TaxID=1069815 RepID=A0ABD3X944_SINWO
MASSLDKDPFTYQKEKAEFIDGLRQFHISRGTPFDRIPQIGSKEVDLYLLYRRVTSLGGWQKINDELRWEELLGDLNLPNACVNGEYALKYIYIRYLYLYEKIHFLGEDPLQEERDTDLQAPARKKTCPNSQYGVPLSYSYEQHKVSDSFRSQWGMSTDLVEFSNYDKLEKALLSGLPNEVDFVFNVCTLLSNESKHSLRLEDSSHLVELLLAHVGLFTNHKGSLERLYENGWRKSVDRDFIRFWFDTVHKDDVREMISYTREDKRKQFLGREVLHMGRDMGVNDKEGLRIMQLAVILRNLSFDEANMKYLAANDTVFRFLMLCAHCNYGCLRQLSLDTLGNMAAKFELEPVDSRRTQCFFKLLIECLTSVDKFAVVRGLEMVSKLCQLERNELALAEKLELHIYEEISKYMTVQDIQLIVSSLEALYQLSELGEETTSKIAQVHHTIDTLVSLITVEAQSYGPNSLVGIKVVEYCPPSQLAAHGPRVGPGPTGVGPPPAQAQSPGPSPMMSNQYSPQPHQQMSQVGSNVMPEGPGIDAEPTTCNWLQATFEIRNGAMLPQMEVITEYLQFCKRYSMPQVQPSQDFLTCLKSVFPRIDVVNNTREDGLKDTFIKGIIKRSTPLPFSINYQGGTPPPSRSAPSPTPSKSGKVSTPKRPGGSETNSQVQKPQFASPLCPSVPAQGYTSSPPQNQNQNQKAVSKGQSSKKGSGCKKMPAAILPRPDISSHRPGGGQYQILMPRTQGPLPLQQQLYATTAQEALYFNTLDNQKDMADTKMIKTLLAKKLRHNQENPSLVPITSVCMSGVETYGIASPLRLEDQIPQIQYQNTAPQMYTQTQPVQQTTLFQYTQPQDPLQSSVQIISNQSVLQPMQQFVVQQTFVVQQASAPIFQPSSQFTNQPNTTFITTHPITTSFSSSIDSSSLPPSSISSSVQKKTSEKNKSRKSISDASQKSAHSSRSASPKSSPVRKSSTGSQSSSPRAESPRSPHTLELDVCGEVETAKDIIEGVEAKIERVENKCLKQHYQSIDESRSVSQPSSNQTVDSTPSWGTNISSSKVGLSSTVPLLGDREVAEISCEQAENRNLKPDCVCESSSQKDITDDSACAPSLKIFTAAGCGNTKVEHSREKAGCEQDFTVSADQCNPTAVSDSEEMDSEQVTISKNMEERINTVDILTDVPVSAENVVEGRNCISHNSPDLDGEPITSVSNGDDQVQQISIDITGLNCVLNETGVSTAHFPVNNGVEVACVVGEICTTKTGPNKNSNSQEEPMQVRCEDVESNEDSQCVENSLCVNMEETISECETQESATNSRKVTSVLDRESSQATEVIVRELAESGLTNDPENEDMETDSTLENMDVENTDLPVEDQLVPDDTEVGVFEGSVLVDCRVQQIQSYPPSMNQPSPETDSLLRETQSAVDCILSLYTENSNSSDSQMCAVKVATESAEVDVLPVNGDLVLTESSDSVKELTEDVLTDIDKESLSSSCANVNNHSSNHLSSSSFSESTNGVRTSSYSSNMDSTDTAKCILNQVSNLSDKISGNKTLVNGDLNLINHCQSKTVPSDVISQNNVHICNEDKIMNGIKENKKVGKKTGAKIVEKSARINGLVHHVGEKNSNVGMTEPVEVDTKYSGKQNVSHLALNQTMDKRSQGDNILDSKPDINSSESQYLQIKSEDKETEEPTNDLLEVVTKLAGISEESNDTCIDTGPTIVGTIVSAPITIMTNTFGPITANVILPTEQLFGQPGVQYATAKHIEICTTRHLPTPETSRDGEFSSESTLSSTMDLIVSGKHSKSNSKIDLAKPLSSPPAKSKDAKSSSGSKSKPKKRSRSKSGGEAKSPMSSSPAAATKLAPPPPEFHCEWAQCKRFFDNTRSVYHHVCSEHLKQARDGVCRWEGCEHLIRKRWSLFTHVQDHHCSEHALRMAVQRRLQAQQSCQSATPTSSPAMVYPPDAAMQAIRRFIPKAPYPEFMEGREGPVTKHIRLTAALILRNLARYSAKGRSLIKKHERNISYSALSAVESSNALSNCLFEILNDH